LPVLYCVSVASDAENPAAAYRSPTRPHGATLQTRKETIMTSIGTFTRQDDGFSGTLRTLAFSVNLKIVPIAKGKDNGPDYRILAGATEIGAAWKRQSAANKPYLSVRLDDPSFASPVNARLVDREDGTAVLYWNRRNDD
jgi:uncharacterized protein (DUF736 family)